MVKPDWIEGEGIDLAGSEEGEAEDFNSDDDDDNDGSGDEALAVKEPRLISRVAICKCSGVSKSGGVCASDVEERRRSVGLVRKL